jgi:hypothetical protein
MRPSNEGTVDAGVDRADPAASSESTIISIFIGRPRHKININEPNGKEKRVTAVDEFTIIFFTSCDCISWALKSYDCHPFRAPLCVVYHETLLQRTYGFLEQFL